MGQVPRDRHQAWRTSPSRSPEMFAAIRNGWRGSNGGPSARRLNHPNVAHIHGLEGRRTDGGRVCALVMERSRVTTSPQGSREVRSS